MSRKRFDRYLPQAQQFGARTVLFQHAAARRLGLTATELECFRLVQHRGPLTAAELARETALTPAAMSLVVDKLLGHGFITRERDSTDRRRWLLHVDEAAFEKVDAVYAAHAARVDSLLDAFTDAEFDAALRFMETIAEELRNTAIQLAANE